MRVPCHWWCVLLATSGCSRHVRGATCIGNVQLEGYGQTSLVNNGWATEEGDGGLVDLLPGGVIRTRIGGRAYLASGCTEGVYSNHQYLAVNFLGKTLRYTLNISGAGCGCNAALYLVSMRQNDNRSDCLDYYCDANSVCGVACDEIDIQEANLFSWHSTLHRFDDEPGYGRGYGGGGQDWNGPRDWAQADYGPSGRCIDTSRPFQVMASFPVDEHGELASLDVKLRQEGRPCSLQLALDSYTGLPHLSRALQAGMTPVVSYWSSDDMLWMDGRGPDQMGPCEVDCPKNCLDGLQFSELRIEDLARLDKKCLGSVSVEGYGEVSLIGAKINKPGQVASRADVHDGIVVAGQRSRLYFGNSCGPGDYSNHEYTALKLLGKSLRFKVDLSAARCGCNAAFYLTNLQQNFNPSQCSDYYCDANQICGVRCAEIDLQEANRHAFYSTLHLPDDSNGLGAGYGKVHREWNSSVYGPNARCIDTLNQFEVNASFPVDGSSGLLAGMEITLTQVGKDCPLSLQIASYLSGGSDGLSRLTESLREGMTPIVSYWGLGENMQWLDGPGSDGQGPCPSEEDSSSTCADSKVYFVDFAVEDLHVATTTEGSRPTVIPTTSVRASATLTTLSTTVYTTTSSSAGNTSSHTGSITGGTTGSTTSSTTTTRAMTYIIAGGHSRMNGTTSMIDDAVLERQSSTVAQSASVATAPKGKACAVGSPCNFNAEPHNAMDSSKPTLPPALLTVLSHEESLHRQHSTMQDNSQLKLKLGTLAGACVLTVVIMLMWVHARQWMNHTMHRQDLGRGVIASAATLLPFSRSCSTSGCREARPPSISASRAAVSPGPVALYDLALPSEQLCDPGTYYAREGQHGWDLRNAWGFPTPMATTNRNSRSTSSLASNGCNGGPHYKSRDSCHVGPFCKAVEEEEEREGEEEPPSSSKGSTAHAMERLGDVVANLDGKHAGLSALVTGPPVSEKVMPVQEQAGQANIVASQLSAPSSPTKRNMAYL